MDAVKKPVLCLPCTLGRKYTPGLGHDCAHSSPETEHVPCTCGCVPRKRPKPKPPCDVRLV